MSKNLNKRILEEGEVINNTYNVDCFIGQGAFGEVYRVKHKFLDDLQVMKVLKAKYVEDSNFDEFVNEGRILSKLTHPNIVRLFNVNTFTKNDTKYFFLTMSFVSGESLSQLLKRQICLSIPDAISIMIDVLKGLDFAHSHEPTVIHRDINPDNILLSYTHKDAVALLGDFGVSMLVGQGTKLAGAAGRYLYFAPECFMDCYLPCSDVFSAGMVFYKMLTGTHPWEYDFNGYDLNNSEDIVRMVDSGRKKPIKKASLFNQEIGEELDKIIFKSLEKNMEIRFRTAGELLKELEAIRNTII